jgi:signal transduction histidine kinase
MAISDHFACFQYVNPAFVRLWGYPDAGQIHKRWIFELLAQPEQSAEILRALREQGSWTGRTEARRRDSSTFLAELTACRTGESNGKSAWVHWYVTGLGERVRPQREELRQLECVTLAGAGLAHDLNNLLTVIMGYSNLALSRFNEPDAIRHRWSEVMDTAQRAAEITQQFLALSRPPAVPPQAVSPNTVIEGVEGLLARLAGDNITLKTSLAANVGRVLAHPVELLQVVMNLVLNARDAMPEGGLISIETARHQVQPDAADERSGFVPGPYVLLTVTDAGSGMDEATRSRAFEAFFTSKPSNRGTGLGLPIVSSIVEKSGGRVLMDTEPGAGTRVRLYFPEAPRG